MIEAREKLGEVEKNLGCKLEEAERRAQNEMKRRLETSNHSTIQIRQLHERIAIVKEELRSKCVQIEDLENRLYEDKPSECWQGWEVKREELVAEQNVGPY